MMFPCITQRHLRFAGSLNSDLSQRWFANVAVSYVLLPRISLGVDESPFRREDEIAEPNGSVKLNLR